MSRKLQPSPGPYTWALGILYDAEGGVIADNVSMSDAAQLAAAPAMREALRQIAPLPGEYPTTEAERIALAVLDAIDKAERLSTTR